MKTISLLAVFIGGGFGSIARYVFSKLTKHFIPIEFPITILGVNIVACFLSGMLGGWLITKPEWHNFRLLLIVGFCGGFSTFSGFSDQTLRLLQEGNYFYSFLDIVLHITLCLAATFLGALLFKQ